MRSKFKVPHKKTQAERNASYAKTYGRARYKSGRFRRNRGTAGASYKSSGFTRTLQMPNRRPPTSRAHVVLKDSWKCTPSVAATDNSIMLIKSNSCAGILVNQHATAGAWVSNTGRMVRFGSIAESNMDIIDQLTGQYSHYHVMGAKLTVVVRYLESSQVASYTQLPQYSLFVGTCRDTASITETTDYLTLTNAQGFVERKATCGTSGDQFMQMKTLTASAYYSPHKVFGTKDTTDDSNLRCQFNGSLSTPPEDLSFFCIALRPSKLNSAITSTEKMPTVSVDYKLEYTIQVSESTVDIGLTTIYPAPLRA